MFILDSNQKCIWFYKIWSTHIHIHQLEIAFRIGQWQIEFKAESTAHSILFYDFPIVIPVMAFKNIWLKFALMIWFYSLYEWSFLSLSLYFPASIPVSISRSHLIFWNSPVSWSLVMIYTTPRNATVIKINACQAKSPVLFFSITFSSITFDFNEYVQNCSINFDNGGRVHVFSFFINVQSFCFIHHNIFVYNLVCFGFNFF